MSTASPMEPRPVARQDERLSRREAIASSEENSVGCSEVSPASYARGRLMPHEAVDPRPLSSSTVIALQRTHGNAHVQRLLGQRAPRSAASHTNDAAPLDIQRDPQDAEVKKHLEAGKKATEEAAKKDAAANARGLKGADAKAKALEAAKADAVAAKQYVAALARLAAIQDHAELSLGKTRGGRDVNAYFFKGAISEVALVIAGVHGSELSGVEVAETLIKRLSAKGAPKPFFSVVIVPQLFPDNVDAKRVWEASQKKAAKELAEKVYQQKRDDAGDPGRYTTSGRYGPGGSAARVDPNRQFPELGKPFDPSNPVDSKGRPIERENIMLLTLIDRFKPVRIASLHAIKNPRDAGIFADPHPSLKGLPASQKDLAARADKLAKLMAEAAKKAGAKVPGNWRGGKLTSLYPGQDPKISAAQIKRENKAGRSLGQWGPSQGMVVLTIELNEQYASDSPVKHPGRKKEIEGHADTLKEIFLGPSLAAFVIEELRESAAERLQQLRQLLLLPPTQPAGSPGTATRSGDTDVRRAASASVPLPSQAATQPATERRSPIHQTVGLSPSVAPLARQASSAPAITKHYTLQSGVTLSADVETKVGQIADDYYVDRKKDIVVTSGTRSASSQASAMYTKLEAGDDIVKLYKNKTAVKEIKKAYDDGKAAKKSRADIVDDMTKVIEKQIKAGTYISKHLRAGAVDVRSKDMSADDKKAFRKAAKGKATKILLETKPPHWHLQF